MQPGFLSIAEEAFGGLAPDDGPEMVVVALSSAAQRHHAPLADLVLMAAYEAAPRLGISPEASDALREFLRCAGTAVDDVLSAA